MEKSEWDYVDEFERIQKEYDLPSFEKLAEDFDVEKLIEKETSFLAREIRRIIVEKFTAYMHLFETLLNPTSTPMFIFSALRSQPAQDKEKMKKIYKKIAKIQLKVMKLDTIYDEDLEGKFIKKVYDEWQELKDKIFKIIDNLDKNYDNDSKSLERGYFG